MDSTNSSSVQRTNRWLELVDPSALTKPQSLSVATLRIQKNVDYFLIHYLTIITAVLAISLLTNLIPLILTKLFLLTILILLTCLVSSTVVFMLLTSTSVGSVLVSGLMVGVAIVCMHGAFRVPEDLFHDDDQEKLKSAPKFTWIRLPGFAAKVSGDVKD